ncbi:MAG TPA: signal peptidase II [Clostridia bacterium]|nr:signal peptidase II [Clostridia bacterium]
MREKKREIVFGLILLDQFSKFIFLKQGFAFFNQGVSFGFLALLPLIALVFHFPKFWGLWLMAAGGVANLIDRLIYGAVVDFISLPWLPAFNLADIVICLGVVWFFIDLGKSKTV